MGGDGKPRAFAVLDDEDYQAWQSRESLGDGTIPAVWSYEASFRAALDGTSFFDCHGAYLGGEDAGWEISAACYAEFRAFADHLGAEWERSGDGEPIDFGLIPYPWYTTFLALYRLVHGTRHLLDTLAPREIVVRRGRRSVSKLQVAIALDRFAGFISDVSRTAGITVTEEHQVYDGAPKAVERASLDWRTKLSSVRRRVLPRATDPRSEQPGILALGDAYEAGGFFRDLLPRVSEKYRPQVLDRSGCLYNSHPSQLLATTRSLLSSSRRQAQRRDTAGFLSRVAEYVTEMAGLQVPVGSLLLESVDSYVQDYIGCRDEARNVWTRANRRSPIRAVVSQGPIVFLREALVCAEAREQRVPIYIFQHGGFYGYTSDPFAFLTDYGLCDRFVACGETDEADIFGRESFGSCKSASFYPLGSSSRVNMRKSPKPKDGHFEAMYVPILSTEFYGHSRAKWDSYQHGRTTIALLSELDKQLGSAGLVKLYQNHPFHNLMSPWLEDSSLAVQTDSLDATLTKFSFDSILLDAPSTALLEILAACDTMVFLVSSQEGFDLTPTARQLLKRRVAISESVEEFAAKFAAFRRSGPEACGVDLSDRSFLDRYYRVPTDEGVRNLIVEMTRS